MASALSLEHIGVTIRKMENDIEDIEMPSIDEEAIALAANEQESEIVSLDKDTISNEWKLSTGHGYPNQWSNATANKEISSKNDVFVISLLGNTTAGKSYVTKHLLAGGDTKRGPHIVSEAKAMSSTTGNINCFERNRTMEEGKKILLLDYEGEKGSSFPRMLYARQFFREKVGFDRQYAKERRRAVTEYFPKLAYVLSNIVILIGKEDLISADYLTRCYEFTLSANKNVTDIPYQPVLIIIQNQSSLAKTFGLDAVTEEFFHIHRKEADDLKNYFSDVFCLRLPHYDQLQRVNDRVLDGRQIFNEQLDELKKCIEKVNTQHQERLITYAQWLFLMENVLLHVTRKEPVSIHSLLTKITASTDDSYKTMAETFFLDMYNKENLHTPRYYRFCRDLSIKFLSRNIAVTLLKHENILSERIIRETCKADLLTLWQYLDQFKPCEAPYMGAGISKSGRKQVFCYQHKAAHPCHRSSEPLKNLSWLAKSFGWSSNALWSGNFTSNDAVEQPNENTVEEFCQTTIDLVNVLKENSTKKYVTFHRLLSEAHARISVRRSMLKTCGCCFTKKRHPLREKLFPFSLSGLQSADLGVCKECFKKCTEEAAVDPDMQKILQKSQGESVDNDIPDEEECVICMAAKKDHSLVPCGHLGFCLPCATRIQKDYRLCPICKRKVDSILKCHNV